MLQNFYEPGERASSKPSIFTFSSASGERVCDLWLINERAEPLARSAHATISSWPARLARLAHQARRARSAHCQPSMELNIFIILRVITERLISQNRIRVTITDYRTHISPGYS